MEKNEVKNRISGDITDPKNQKLRITTFIDGDIYDELNKRAAEAGGKYQTLMNKVLRDALFPQGGVNQDVVAAVIAEVLQVMTKRKKNMDTRDTLKRGAMAHSRAKPTFASTKKRSS